MSEINGRIRPHWSLTAAQVLVLLVLAGMAFVMHQMYWPVNVMDIEMIEVLNPVVKAGDRVRIRFTVNKHVMTPTVVQRTLVNQTITTYIEEHGTQPLGRSTKTIELLIPKDKHEGKYHVSSTVIARVNHFRYWQKTWETPWFYVLGSDSDEKIKVIQKDINKLEQNMEKNNTKLKGFR
jgi:hypothetical protein